MSLPTESYLKVSYDLRPAKQVERRMFLEAFQILASNGYSISEYQYTGFGSIYFVDFILFHKLLGINHMLSVEHDGNIRRRVFFNQPFRCVTVKIGKIYDEIPRLTTRRKHILWLDYDSILVDEHLQDVWLAAASLPSQSIILVTVDVEPPVKNNGTPRKWRHYFRDVAGKYLGNLTSVQDFTESKLVNVNREIVTRAMRSGLAARGLEYIPMFSFSYADGHEMLTVGGMIGTPQDRQRVQDSSLSTLPYIRFDESAGPYRIVIPLLTRKERIYLDKTLPPSGTWDVRHFELPMELAKAYRNIYRYMPSYAELVL